MRNSVVLFICLFAMLVLASATQPVSAPENHSKALQTVRLLNTLEAIYQSEHKLYADLPVLVASDAFADAKKDESLEAAGQGRTLIASLSFEKPEVIPGWYLKVVVSGDNRHYSLTLRHKDGEVITSDETGLVSVGHLLR